MTTGFLGSRDLSTSDMEAAADSYLSLLEDNHYELVKSCDPEVFLDYMQQHRVLSEEDCQVVRNFYINTSRRARMRCFLEIVGRKGPDNIQHFFLQLGWEYPHVYRHIFRSEPKPAPQTYQQDSKSRLSCDLNKLLTFGINMTQLRNQQQNFTDQIKDMEAMLKHQKNEIEDLERENQRLRQHEKDNHQIKERLKSVTVKNDEIKEENRQFLHEIRTLRMELEKKQKAEITLLTQLDEMRQQIQEKSFELTRKSKEESEMRAKFEKAYKASIKFSRTKSRLPNIVATMAQDKLDAKQTDLGHQMEILMNDMKDLEENNRGLCDQLQYMEDLLAEEKMERDQMHRRVVVLEHEKNALETRQDTSVQKIERFFSKIKELEQQKGKLEEERMHMQAKLWEQSQVNDKQFEQLHKLEVRYDHLQQGYDQFRQGHRHCSPDDVHLDPRPRLPNMVNRQDKIVPPRSPRRSPNTQIKEDPFKYFSGFHSSHHSGGDDCSSSPDVADGDRALILLHPAMQDCKPSERGISMAVNPSASMKCRSGKPKSFDSEDDDASTVSELSSVSSSTFDHLDIFPSSLSEEQSDHKASEASGDGTGSSNFFIRSNIQEDADPGAQTAEVAEGEILFVVSAGEENWTVKRVDKASGKLCQGQTANIPSLERHRSDSFTMHNCPAAPRRKQSGDQLIKNANSLTRMGAIKGMKRQQSYTQPYTRVYPMKATRKLPVLMMCPPSVTKPLLRCMESEGSVQDWANIVPDGVVDSSSQLFAESPKHYVLQWDVRPRDPQKYDNNLHKFIILIVTLESEKAVDSLRCLLGEPGMCLDFKDEMDKLKDKMEMAQRFGLHNETVTVLPGQDNRDAFFKQIRDKVNQGQRQIFWLETPPRL